MRIGTGINIDKFDEGLQAALRHAKAFLESLRGAEGAKT